MTQLVPGVIVTGGQVAPGTPNANENGIQSSQSLHDQLLAASVGIKSKSILASDGVDIDVTTAKNIEIDMDTDISNLTYSISPTRNLQPLIISYFQSVGGKTITFDSAKFRGGMDVGLPALTGILNSTEYSGWVYNLRDGVFDCVGFFRTYGP